MTHEDNKRRVVRATSWDEIFSDKRLEAAHFQMLVDYFVTVYGEDLSSYDTEKSKKGEKVILKRSLSGDPTTEIIRRHNRDVHVIFTLEGRVYGSEKIRPSIGNIHHQFSMDDLVVPEQDGFNWDDQMSVLTGNAACLQFIRGKLASRGWEKKLKVFGRGETPLRIGYFIFVPWVLDAASQIRDQYPTFYTRTKI